MLVNPGHNKPARASYTPVAFGWYWPQGSLVGIPYCGSVMMWTMAGQFVMSSTLVQDSHSLEMSLQRGPGGAAVGGAPVALAEAGQGGAGVAALAVKIGAPLR